MPLINWTENLSTKIPSIDKQHKKLIELLNRLHDAMREGRGKEVLGTTLDELISYTKTHFTYEEELMKKANYPDLANHKKEHEQLVAKVLDLQKKYNSGSVTMTIETLNFLKDWLNNHILVSDKKYGPVLSASGIQ
jgi:hemerythrin-like metal-binding protein